jgi:hypothetical protein
VADWHWIDSGDDASNDDAEQWPDAVYDADDPEWESILADYDDGPALADYDDSWGDPDDWGWDDWPVDWDGEWYEVEIGIDYGEDS